MSDTFSRDLEYMWKPMFSDNANGFRNFRLSSPEDDMLRGIDAYAIHTQSTEIIPLALRWREMAGYPPVDLEQYLGQFTIRASRPSGAATDYDKWFGEDNQLRLFAYGWCHRKGWPLRHYIVLSLKVLRSIQRTGVLDEQCSVGERTNSDTRHSTLRAYSIGRVQQHTNDRAILFASDQHPGLSMFTGDQERDAELSRYQTLLDKSRLPDEPPFCR